MATYARKLSAEEGVKNAVLLSEKALAMLPAEGTEFKVFVGKKQYSATVSRDREGKPFLHLFSPFDFKRGRKVSIRVDKKGAVSLKAGAR